MSLSPTETEQRLQAGFRRQCLFAVTILLVEDSRSASEAIRLFAAESGARVRRADSLHSASRHLAIYRPNVVMVDLGLPDGNGMSLIRHLASASTPIGGIIALSGHDRAAWQGDALAAGAAACLEKPIESLRAFQDVILSVLPDGETRRPDGRALSLDGRASVQAAFVDDLRRAWGLLREAVPSGDRETIAYCAQFLGSVGEMLEDAELGAAARAAGAGPDDSPTGGARLVALLEARLARIPGGVRAQG